MSFNTITKEPDTKRSITRTIDFSVNASAAAGVDINLDLLKKTKDNL